MNTQLQNIPQANVKSAAQASCKSMDVEDDVRKKAFDIPALDGSLKRDYDNGTITLEQAAIEFYTHGWTRSIDYDYTKNKLGITDSVADSSEGTAQNEQEIITFDHEATYSAEDDKIRIYFSYRLDSEEYARVKKLGFRPAPKQGCHFAVWSPNREDFALEMAGEITAEGTTLAERAAAKASRLENLAVKNIQKSNSFLSAANSISERFAYGQPILVGHHSERKARRDKSRMESALRESNRAAGMVDYWNYKATAVEHHANYKNRDDVRARRIKTLLAELRQYQRVLNDSYGALAAWEALDAKKDDEGYASRVLSMCGFQGMSPYIDGFKSCCTELEEGRMTADQVVELSLNHHYKIIDGRARSRCIAHTLNRLAYERSELGEVPRFTGGLTPVILQAFLREHGADSPKVTACESGFKACSPVPFPMHIDSALVTDITLSDDQWRELMQSSGYEVLEKKPRRKSKSDAASIPLINPTAEDAKRLQDLWNQRYIDRLTQLGTEKFAKPASVLLVSQKTYSANSQSEYDPLFTIELDAQGHEVVKSWHARQQQKSSDPVCRIRVKRAGELYGPRSVLIIEDKAGKALPLDWEAQN